MPNIKENNLNVLARLVAEHLSSTLPPEYLTTEQVSQLTGFSVRALENMRARRIGPAFSKLGNGARAPVRYHIDDVRRWFASYRMEAEPYA